MLHLPPQIDSPICRHCFGGFDIDTVVCDNKHATLGFRLLQFVSSTLYTHEFCFQVTRICNGGTASAQLGERATAYSKVAAEDHHAEAILHKAEELLQVRHAEVAQRRNEDQAGISEDREYTPPDPAEVEVGYRENAGQMVDCD